MLVLSVSICYGQSKTTDGNVTIEVNKRVKSNDNEISGTKYYVDGVPVLGRRKFNKEEDYLKPCKISLTEAIIATHDLNIDSFFTYKAWLTKKLKANLPNLYQFTISVQGSISYHHFYLGFNNKSDKLIVIQVPSTVSWCHTEVAVEKISHVYKYKINPKFARRFQPVCKKAISQTREFKNSSFCLDGEDYIFTAGRKSGYTHCTGGLRVETLTEIVDHLVKPVRYNGKIDNAWLLKKVKLLMEAYDLE